MKTTRREFIGLLAAGTALTHAAVAQAQRRPPDAGIDYKVLERPQPTESGSKLEIAEFFWYGCPHCFAFEPSLGPWIKKLAPDVSFRRVPALFGPAWVQHAKLYYALESLGEVDRLHRICFETIHLERQPLAQDAEMIDWAGKNGVDRGRFGAALAAAANVDRFNRVQQLINGYGVDGVPAMGVNGRFLTSPSMVGSQDRCLSVIDALIDQERRTRRT